MIEGGLFWETASEKNEICVSKRTQQGGNCCLLYTLARGVSCFYNVADKKLVKLFTQT
jgi:hypothetical protein